MSSTFTSKDGDQNIAQGRNAIGKQKSKVSTTGNQSPAIQAGGDVDVTYKSGLSSEEAVKLATKMMEPLQCQLAAKDEQIKALTEAITALARTGAPAVSINAALQELQHGDTEKAKAIFAEVLKTKEAEGKQATKEAAAAARHLGALAFLHDTNGALAAYRKAVELDPDNADGWNRLGHLFLRTGELAQAEDAYCKVLALSEIHQDKEEQAVALGNLGLVYDTRGDLYRAEEMHRKALAIDEVLGNKEGLSKVYCNLGLVFCQRNELDKAEEMYQKSLVLNASLGSKEGMAGDYGNLGNVYRRRGDLSKAEELHRKSIEISEHLGLMETTANAYGNLGIVYDTRGEIDKAEEMHRTSIALHEALGQKEGVAANYANLGSIYKQRGNPDQTEEVWKKSLRLYQEMGYPNAMDVQQWLNALAQKKANSSSQG